MALQHSKRIVKMLLAVAVVAVAVSFAIPSHAAADDTTNYPWIRPDNWLSQIIASPSGGTGYGHLIVDLLMDKSGQTYNPCHNSADTFYGACDSGVYKVLRWRPGSNDFPFGIFVDNSNNGLNHFWARRVGAVFLELYPYSVPETGAGDGYRLDPGACGCTVYGGFQVIVNDWKGGYSRDIGSLRPTSLADPDVGRLNGFVRRSGTPVKSKDVNIDWFGQDSSSGRSTAGYPVYSFASWPTNNDGYYTSGPVLKGNYHIYVLDKGANRKVECFGMGVKSTSDRQDIELTAQHFGLDAPGRQCYDRAP